MSKTLVGIPCYNCGPQIPRVLAGLASGPVAARVDGILIIDNGSTDDTVKQALDAVRGLGLSSKTVIVRNDRNYGLGGSQKVAFRWAATEGFGRLAIVHGDAQGSPGDLPRLLEESDRSPELAAVLGARFMPGSTLIGYSKLRTYGNLGLNLLYSGVALRRTYDLGSGLNVFTLRDFPPETLSGFADGFTFNIDLLLYLYSSRKALKFAPISWAEVDQVSNAGNVRVGLGALKALAAWRLGLPSGEAGLTPSYSHRTVYPASGG